MKKYIILFVIFLSFKFATAQLCPGGGTTFSSAVVFDQSWISSCSTGTSCNGGVEFDNRSSCEPTTSVDLCAQSPSCTSTTNGSDIWFKFYANSTTASIKVIQNVSFVASIQAFTDGLGCSDLTQIGCVVSNGPSGGVTLSLSELTPNALYYFRVFGSANNQSQRTGTYCFCGSVGLNSTSLPIILTSFDVKSEQNSVLLSWHTSSELNNKYFEVQRNKGENNFQTIGIVKGKGSNYISADYTFTDNNPNPGKNLYRLKQVDLENKSEYSKIVVANVTFGENLFLASNFVKEKLTVQSLQISNGKIFNEQGQLIRNISIKKGANEFSVRDLSSGFYFIQSDTNESLRFFIAK